MNKNNFILVLLVISISVFSCKNKSKKNDEIKVEPGTTIISGQLKNFRNSQIILNSSNSSDTIFIKEDGSFEKVITISTSSYFDFINDNNTLILYLIPEDNLIINADCNQFNKTVKFKGKSKEANEYLNNFINTINTAAINSENFLYSSELNIFKNSLNELISKLTNNLKDFKNNSKEFKKFADIEEERIKMLKTSLMISYYNPILRTDKKNSEFEKELESSIFSVDFNNKILMQFPDFKSFSFNIINYMMNIELRETKKELKTATEYTKLFFEYLKKLFTESEIKDELYYIFIKEFMNFYGAESVYENYETYKSFTSNRQHLSELDKIFEEFSKTAPGKASINWSFPDKNGKIYSLTDFRGKYVYIDVWASWCGPCLRELPFFKNIYEKYKNRNIAIISISVDENRSDWLNKIESEKMPNLQLYAGGWNNDLCNFFKINGIPRFILLDKEGNIINANAERPSGNIENELKKLPGL